ncbi:MAG: thioredoxin domain-containing protein [Candidatus Moranbacteria bacterium]|nr:thioredoxin domain-containing protein [Candidatus Moranbacteria bacterium]
MNQETIPAANQSHPLQKPLMLIAIAVMFAGILVAGAIVATQILPMPSLLKSEDAAVIPIDEDQKSAPKEVKDGIVSLSLGNDPVLGDKTKAKIAIIEFSDYECPFCKKFHTETLDTLIKDYVDTGKAVLSFKDFPLSFHEPMASKEAAAANCVQKLSGDKTYFSYSALLYKNTATNGKGMTDTKMTDLAIGLGIPREVFADCVTKNDFKDEIEQDLAEGEEATVTGTPAFIIGTLGSDGSVTDGVKLVGAQPLEAFRKALDAQLQ